MVILVRVRKLHNAMCVHVLTRDGMSLWNPHPNFLRPESYNSEAKLRVTSESYVYSNTSFNLVYLKEKMVKHIFQEASISVV